METTYPVRDSGISPLFPVTVLDAAPNQIVALYGPERRHGALTATFWDFDNPTTPFTHELALPMGLECGCPLVSPDHRRLLWEDVHEDADAKGFESLWTANIDGSHLREVGKICFGGNRPSAQYFGGLAWVPGKDLISFVYMQKLYEVKD